MGQSPIFPTTHATHQPTRPKLASVARSPAPWGIQSTSMFEIGSILDNLVTAWVCPLLPGIDWAQNGGRWAGRAAARYRDGSSAEAPSAQMCISCSRRWWRPAAAVAERCGAQGRGVDEASPGRGRTSPGRSSRLFIIPIFTLESLDPAGPVEHRRDATAPHM